MLKRLIGFAAKSNLIRHAVSRFFKLLGIKIFVISKYPKHDWILFDRNQLSSYFVGDKIRTKYQLSLNRTGMEWSDNLSKQFRFYGLYQMAEYAISNNPNSHFAECGCWKGHSTHLISTLLKENAFTGRFHIFDSFEGGLSSLSENDKNQRYDLTEQQVKDQQTWFSSEMKEVACNLEEFEFVSLYKGWIPDRFPEVKDIWFSFVHLDVDLYQPYWDSLCFFYERLNKGGVMYFDDYGLTQFPGAQKAVEQFFSDSTPCVFFQIPTGGAFVIK